MPDYSYSVTMTGDITNLAAISLRWHNRIYNKYKAAARETLRSAKADAPIDTGALVDSGEIEEQESGVGEFSIDVSFGGDLPVTAHDYSYSASSSVYSDGAVEAGTYAWFQELGTKNMAAQPFLGANFDFEVDGLIAALNGILDT